MILWAHWPAPLADPRTSASSGDNLSKNKDRLGREVADVDLWLLHVQSCKGTREQAYVHVPYL